MTLSHYINFDGNCREAFAYYQTHLGASAPQFLSYGDGPMSDTLSPADREKVMHASITIHGFEVAGTDAVTVPYVAPHGMRIILNVEDADEAQRLFSALSDGGQVLMDLHETFWAVAFAVVTDRFNVPWTINCPKEAN